MEASFSKILVICRFACSCCSRAAFFRSSSWWSSWLFQRRNEEVICKSLLQRRFSIQLARWDPYCNEIWQADLELLYCMFELFFCSSVKYVWFSFESKHIKQQPLQESSLILDTDIMLSLMTWAPGSWWHLLKQGYGSWKSFDDTIHCVEVYYIDSNMEWTRRLICKHSSLYTSCISMRKLTLCTTITSNYVLTMSLAAIFQCRSDAVALVPKNGSKDGQHHPIGEHHESVKKDLTWHRGQKYLQHTATLLFFQRPAHKKKHPKRNKCAATPRWEYGVLPPFLSKVWWLSSCCKSQMPPTVETIGLTTDWSSFINLKSARNDLQTSQEIMGNSMGFLNESCDPTLRS